LDIPEDQKKRFMRVVNSDMKQIRAERGKRYIVKIKNNVEELKNIKHPIYGSYGVFK
jgi:phage terminase large subunit